MDKQVTRDKEIFDLLTKFDPFVAKTYFEGVHWEKLPNSPFDTAFGDKYTVYAAQSAAITVLARETDGSYELQFVGW